MTEHDADERVARYILNAYRKAHRDHHLADCPEVDVVHPDAEDGVYGCPTGCEYVIFTATLRCPHEQHRDFEYGDFGTLASVLAEMDHEPPPLVPMVFDQALTAGASVYPAAPLGGGMKQITAHVAGLTTTVVVTDATELQVRAYSNTQGVQELQLVDDAGEVVACQTRIGYV